MVKTINVGGRAVVFKATASTLTRYSAQYGRDILKDFDSANKELLKGSLCADSLVTLFNLAHIMAKQADPTITNDPDEWLDTFDTFPINEVLPQIANLWIESMGASVEQKKV